MKKPYLFSIKLFFFLLLLWPWNLHSQQEWQLDEGITQKYSRQIEGENYFTLETNNAELTGVMYYEKGGTNLKFRLIRNGTILWEKPSPSNFVIIPDIADLVIMVTYQEGEGFVKEGRVIFSGLSAYDLQGNYLGKIETGPLGKLFATEDGKVLFYSGGMLSLAISKICF